MSSPIAVRDLAKELGITDRELVKRAEANGLAITTFSRLDAAQAERVRRMFAGAPRTASSSAVPVATARPAERTVVTRSPAAGAPPASMAAPAAESRSGVVRRRLRTEEETAPVAPAPVAPPAPAVVAPPPVVAAPEVEPEPARTVAPAKDVPRLRRAKVEDLVPPAELQLRPVTPALTEEPAPAVPPVRAEQEAPRSEPVAVAPEPVAPPAPVGPTPEEVAAEAVAAERRRELGLMEIGAAITREEAPASSSKVPRIIRHKMPEVLKEIPKPTPRPQPVEERPAAVAPPVEVTTGRREVTVDDRGRGRKVIYDRRRDSMSSADGGRMRGKKRQKGAKMAPAVPVAPASAIKRTLKIEDTITVANLAHQLSVKGTEVIRKLFELGMMATVNQAIDLETAELVAGEFGYTVENVGFDLDAYLQKPEAKGEEQPRPPVVTVMGHVDHGKTSLLDAIRKTHTAAREAGGITQHIGAYVARVKSEGGAERKVVFLDTPGHEAFSAMRARGAKATDVIVLVVAADDGVMPQTIEAINHAKAANVPIIVAVNKIDKPGADLDRVRRELSEHGINSEEWGGDTIFCEVSAKVGTGLDRLLEMLALQSDVLDLKANPDADARGLVIESRLEKGRGPVATLLVQTGTLKKGQYVVAGNQYCRVRAMLDDNLKNLDEAGPSTPAEVIGFDTVTSAGDEFYVVADEKKAKAIVEHRVEKAREKELLKTSKRTLEEMMQQQAAGEVRDLNLIVKADVHGSAEALKQALSKIEHEEVKVRVLHAAVGGVTESDINLAATSKAVIIAFNVKPEAKGKRLADDMGVEIKQYSVIYEAIDEVTLLLEGMLTPIIEENVLGHAEVRQIFNVPKLGTICGCSVLDGVLQRSAKMRLFRGKEMLWEGEVASLKRFKDDVKEVAQGYECGVGLQGFSKANVGDRLECYELKKIPRKLKPEGTSSQRQSA